MDPSSAANDSKPSASPIWKVRPSIPPALALSSREKPNSATPQRGFPITWGMTQRSGLLPLAQGVSAEIPLALPHWPLAPSCLSGLADGLGEAGKLGASSVRSVFFWLRDCNFGAARLHGAALKSELGEGGARSALPPSAGNKTNKKREEGWGAGRGTQSRVTGAYARGAFGEPSKVCVKTWTEAAVNGGGIMQTLAFFVSLALVLLATHCRGQDELSLEDALGPEPTKGSASSTKKPPSDDGFDLGDALGGDSNDPAAPPQPKPGSHDNTGGLSDSDLFDGEMPPEKPPSGEKDAGSTENTEGSQGMIAGIISSVIVAIVGAASSFIAYQKKKLCFKASDQENVNMESHQGAHAEPPVQRTLLQKQ